MAITPAMLLPVLVAPSHAHIEDALESEVIQASALAASDEYFAQHGAEHPLGIGFSGGQDLLPQVWDEQTVLSHIKGIGADLVRDMALVGTPDEVLEQAAGWRDAGVRHLVVMNSAMAQRSLRRGVAAVPSFFTVIKGLKRL